jgi:uncharacterized protein YjdB
MKTLLHLLSTILLICFAQTTALFGQITYLDVPDQTLSLFQAQGYDLNADGNNDVIVNVGFANSATIITLTRSSGTNPVQTLQFSGAVIDKLALNEAIGPGSGTYTTGSTSSCFACIRNLFPWAAPPTNDVYVGFRMTFIATGTTHYAWMLCDVPTAANQITVKAFGWENTPNTPILAGDQGAAILVSNIDVYGQGGATTISAPGGTLQMLTTTTPSNAADTSKTWSVNNTAIATINTTTGLLTAQNNGTVRVFATANDGSGISGFEDITISGQFIPVTSISIQGQGGATSVLSGNTLQMVETVLPANATDQTVSWGVINGTGTASINSTTGLLTGGVPGQVQVTATANDGTGVADTTTITVDPILVSGITVSGQGGATSVLSGNTLQMNAAVTPANASDPSVTWSVTNGTGSATINPSTGLLTGGTPGTVTVCATANDASGTQDCITITVDPILVTGITVSGQGGATNVLSGNTLQMNAVVTPANASDPSVTWSVTNGTGTATINVSTGLLSAGSPGTVTVCATANDGSGVQDCITITVDPILVTGITVSGQGGATNVQSGNTLQMNAAVTPANASNPSVTWSVTNGTGTATINTTSGLLTGVDPGTVTVCATANDGSGLQDCITITVDPVLVTGITVSGQGGATTVLSGNTLQMNAAVTPANASDPSVTWSVSNGTGSANINASTGVLTGGSPGTVTVCATANDGSGIQDCITITVDPILVTGITVSGQGGATTVLSGNTLQMNAAVTPANASDPSVTWSVSNGTGSANINASTGVLTGGSPGTVTVCATANDGSGIQDCITITVDPILVTGITVSGQGGVTTVLSGNTLQMNAAVTPANASDPSVTWSVTNGTGSANINASTGVLTGGSPGTVTVCATANDGSGIQDCITITVDPILVTGITVSGQGGATTVLSGNTLQMNAAVTPANASDPSVTWSVTNGTGSANINASTGVLTGGSPGTVTVCATANDGSGIQDCITITVDPILVTGITVSGQGGATTVLSGNTLQMNAAVTPANASDPSVTWSVTNGTGSANINASTGVLTGGSPGTVTVCATANDGSGIQDCITITVDPILVTGITVSGQGGATTVLSGNTLQMNAAVTPANASDPSVTWSVSNGTGSANINASTGVLTGGSPGTVTVCATANDGSGIQDCITITVDPVLVTGITVSGQGGATTVLSGNTLQMNAAVTPANASDPSVTWSVSNGTGSANINASTGVLTGGSPGTVTVCATANDGSGIQDCITITVDPVLVTGITVSGQGGATTVISGNTLQMNAAVTPANASDPSVTWSVSNGTGSANINASTGVLTGGSPGTVTVCATANDGSGVQDCITITVDPILVTNITVQGQGGATTVISGNTLLMEATVTPANASNPSVTWSLTNGTGTATINPSTGLLTAGTIGTVTVCATANDGSGTQGCTTITIDPILVTNITVQGQGGVTSVTNGSTLQMVETVTPANATDPSVTWSVTNGTGSATINPTTGVLTATAVGTVTVCATANDGSGVQGCTTINVNSAIVLVSTITVSGQGGATSVVSGNTLQMIATITPANATDQTVTWSVFGGTGSATIDPVTGVLTGTAVGTVTVCATANDASGVSDCVTINVIAAFVPVSSITVSGQAGATNVLSGSTLQMVATISPANATDQSVTWSVTNGTGTATIDPTTGVLTAGNPGTVTVCATANDGSGVSDCTTITVDPILVTNITVSGQGGATNVQAGNSLQMLATVTPANASDPSVTWSVTNGTGSATINPTTGLLTGGNIGTVTVCATANDGSGVSDCIIITIDPILVTNITVSGQGGATNVQAGNSLQMVATVLPANASDPSVTWSVTNGTGSATINPTTGVLTAGNVGTVTVCATANDGSGISDCTTITVDPILVSSISVQGQGGATTVNTGASLQMVATVLPANATNTNVTWSVTNGTGSATINASTGVLTGSSAGTVTVCATANDGSGVQGCTTITINTSTVLVTGITVSGQGGATNVQSGNTLQMIAAVLPANASNPSVTWSVTNGTGSATINATTGVLTGGNVGTVTVCATANDGSGVSDCITITIDPVLVTNITVQGQGGATAVNTGASLQMVATVTPANATNPSVTWSVTNGTGSATINATTGVLTGGTAGTVTVCATANDGSGEQGCTTINITTSTILVSNITVQGQGGVSNVLSGNTLQMQATITPSNATNTNVTWSVTNGTGSATINLVTGLLTGGTPGTVTVCATAVDGSGAQGCTTITIDPILVSGITVSAQGGATNVLSGNSLQMNATVSPANASDPSVTWSVTNGTGSATINPTTGVLTGGTPGTVTVCATANDGSATQNCVTITVDPILVTAISVSGQGGATNVTSGSTLQMLASVTPANASDPSVTWSVTNGTGSATINPSTGVLTGGNVGTVTVCATANDGSGVQDCITITIDPVLVSTITVQGQGGATSVATSGNLQMIATVLPVNATNQSVTWSVTNGTGTASINTTSGVLTGLTAGTVTVCATATDGSGIQGCATITVVSNAVFVSSITVSGQGGATAVTSGNSLQMIATILPANATNQNVTWSVTNGTGTATINTVTGVLTGGSAGTVTVCATAVDGSGTQGCTTITIDPILVTNITVQGQGGITNVLSGNNLQMIATVTPTNATNPSVTWSITPGTGTATINPTTGLLTGGNPGTVAVVATANDGSGISGSAIITVGAVLVSSITVQGQGGVSTINTPSGSLQMIATILPVNANNQSVTWSVNNTSIATINASNGLLTALADGSVTVTATANDGSGISGSAVITISNQTVLVTSVQVQGQNGIDYINTNAGTLQMIATVLPTSATNQSVTWSVDDPGIATIDQNGLLTALTNGVVLVTATANDGSGASGSKLVTISNQGGTGIILVNSISVLAAGGANSIDLPGGTLQMFAVVAPSNATNTDVTWSVSNSAIAQIDSFGLLRAKNTANGQVLVVATARDGSGVSGSKLIDINNQITAYELVEGEGSSLKVFPNPFKEQTNIEIYLKDYSNNNVIEIFDMTGRLLHQENLNLSQGLNEVQLRSMKEWSSGMYLLRIRTDKDVLSTQILKQ